MDVIRATHLSKSFGLVKAVDDIGITVKQGAIYGFLGPNGAGKTTTIRMLTGVLTPDAGSVVINGIDMARDPLSAKQGMGVIPENGTVYGDLTAEVNLLWTGKFYGMDRLTRERRAEELLSQLGLAERKDDLVRTYSKGMRQRIGIACAIIHSPPVLFLDEPTSGLDVASRRLVIRTIREMNQQRSTIFLTTHNIEEASALCTTVSIIHQGRIIATDSPERLRKTYDLTHFVEVTFEQPVKADYFPQDGIISRVEPWGDKWRLYTDNPDQVIKFLAHQAEQDHLTILSLATSSPSLEEAFVQLTEGEG
jgi:ABC-2 type transport system ATP-binding protein